MAEVLYPIIFDITPFTTVYSGFLPLPFTWPFCDHPGIMVQFVKSTVLGGNFETPER